MLLLPSVLSLLPVAWILATTTDAAAAPTQHRPIEIPLVRNQARRLRMTNGRVNSSDLSLELVHLTHKYAKTLQFFSRNTGRKHAFDAAAAGRRAVGAVPLVPQQQGALWTGAIAFGTPAQRIPIDFDTGSADTLVNPEAYDPSQSRTSHNTGATFQNEYGDGTTASGKVYADQLTIGGLEAKKAYIGRSKTAFIQDDGNAQGISGLAFPVLSSFAQKEPFFESLAKAGALDKRAFTMNLRKGGGSRLVLGDTSPKAQYVPLSDVSYWAVEAKVNGQKVSSIIDSGTTLIVAPVLEAQQLFESLKLSWVEQSDGSVLALYDCSTPPKVQFTFGPKTVPLDRDAVSYGTTSNGQCIFSIIGQDISARTWILGDPIFLASKSITFDVAGKRVGFE